MFDVRAVMDALSEIIYAVDIETEKLIYINSAGEKMLGDCVGMTVTEAIGDKLCRTLPSETDITDSGFYIHKYTNKDTGKTYMLKSKVIRIDGKDTRIEIAADITDAERERHELETRLNMEHFIVSCIIEMHKNKPLNETIDYVLALTGKTLEADKVYIFDCGGNDIKNAYVWRKSEEIADVPPPDAHMIDIWRNAMKKNGNVIVKDIETIKDAFPNEYKFLRQNNIQRLVIAPIEDNDEIIGFMGINNLPEEKIAASELFFATLSYFMASVIIRERNEESLRRMSYIDTLTNLYNRNKFIEDCRVMEENKEKNVGVIYMDLNGLKEINDKKGHDAGDTALKSLADIIFEVFDNQTAYRVGGDEFVILCHDIDENTFLDLVDALQKRVENSEYTSAIGYQYEKDGCDVDEVIKTADEKMYLDKKYFYRNQKSSRYRFRNDTFAAIATPDSLKKLISEERFVIWFQPRFSAETKEFCGSEALVRFFDEDEVLVSPMDFIPEMEDNGTIHLIDFYVFRHVCEYLSGWIKVGKNVKPVSVNMSHTTMTRPGFMENIMEIWFNYNIPKELIIIEVNEEQDKGGVAKIANILSNLKKRGFQIAIDNFGSRYADLYLFADLKFDILKLDGDMVYKIETDPKTRILSSSIAQICHSENIRIVAEGVENENEFQLLKDMGCDEMQGYLFDKPMSWNWFEKKYL